MRRIGLTALCVLALGTAAAVNAAEASAAPEFLHKALPLTLDGFTGKAGASKIVVHYSTTVELAISCSAGKILSGEVEFGVSPATKKVEEVHMEFTGCKGSYPESGKVRKCTPRTPGKPAGTISLRSLDGELGEVLLAEAADERGLDLKPESGTVVMKIEATGCGVPLTIVEGSVIGEIEPKKVEKKELNLVYTAVGSAQKIKVLGSNPPDVLEAAAKPVTLQSTFVLKFAEVAPGVEVT